MFDSLTETSFFLKKLKNLEKNFVITTGFNKAPITVITINNRIPFIPYASINPIKSIPKTIDYILKKGKHIRHTFKIIYNSKYILNIMFKTNFNHLHYLLSENFENIEVSEKADDKIGQYIELTVESDLECKITIPKKNLESPSFNWTYLADPTNMDSIVERSSNINTFANDVVDIFENKRFSKDYLTEKEETE